MATDNLKYNSSLDSFEKSFQRSNNIRAFKKVSFNVSSSNDYITNEAYKALRTNILFSGSNIKTIVITSCNENDGKSTVSTELAKSLAEGGKKTLLIDADMRKSVMLRKSIRADEIEGLSEVLSGLAKPKEVIYNTQNPNFDVIFTGHFPPNPVELLGNGILGDMLQDFKNKYDYVIIDSPPLGMVIDAAVIAQFCDSAILVIPERKIQRSRAISIKEQLTKSGCKILGVVLNVTDKASAKPYRKYYGKYGSYGTPGISNK